MKIKSVNLLPLLILLITACAPLVASAKSAGPTQTMPSTLNHLGPLKYYQGTWLPGVPPNGTWRTEISSRDILHMGMMQSDFKNDWVGKYMFTFKDGNYAITWQNPKGNTGQCRAKVDADRYVVRLTYIDSNQCSREVDYFLLPIDGNELHIHLLGVENMFYINRMVVFDSTVWTKVQ